MNLELRKVIEDNYSNDWIVLSSRDEITLYPETRFQEGHYGFKPKGLWLGKGTDWLDFIEVEGMDSFITSYCSAFKVDLGNDILILKDFEDYRRFTLRYGVSSGKIDWKKVAKNYNGIIVYSPRRFQFKEELEWVYGWDITSACIWDADGIEDVKKVYDNCEDELFKKGGSVTTWKHKYNKKYGYPKDKSHSLKEISKDTGVSMKGIRQIYNKGIGAYKTNPSSVRPNVKSKEQWAYARVYSAVMGGKASKVDAKELKMETGGKVPTFWKFWGKEYELHFKWVERYDYIGLDVYAYLPIRTILGTIEAGKNVKLQNDWQVINVTIQDEFQGQGLGTILYEQLFSKLKGQTIYSDTTINSNAVHKIWKNMGAEEITDGNKVRYVLKEQTESYARGGKASKFDAKELKMEMGGLIKGSELIEKVSSYGSREGTDMIEFANENINPESNYVLTEIKVSELINNDMDLASFVDEVIDNPTMYSDVTEFENPNTHIMPIVINDKGLVVDGYGRVANSVYNDFDRVFAYVPNDLNKYEFGGQVCTYDFEGYEVYKRKCGENVAQYLIPAEYDRVSIWLFENEFPLWMYYNYLARITASAENILTFKTQFQKEFDLEDYNVDLKIEPESNKKFWENQPYGKARSFMSYSEDGSGKIRSLGITLVAGGEWTKRFKERTSGLNIPHPVNGVLLNTAIHEFAHLLDVIRYNQKNPNEKIIVTHQRGFLIALRDILIKCRNNEIAIVGILDNKAYLTQKLLQDEGYQEMFRKQYGIKKETRPNVLKLSINVTIPKELKEYDSRLDVKGKPLSDMEVQEIRTLIDEYKKTELMQISELDFKKAERLYNAINKITLELKRIEKNIAFDEIKEFI
jgi:GNAT superfamily N-acetyltransferase